MLPDPEGGPMNDDIAADDAPALCGRPDCRHIFDDHVFEAPGDPLGGGTYHCPVLGCYCSGTWSVTMDPHAGKGAPS
jgi:hypothetical protein